VAHAAVSVSLLSGGGCPLTTVERAGAATVLMHCMPVRSGDEVIAAAYDDHRRDRLEGEANLGPTHTAIVSHVLWPAGSGMFESSTMLGTVT
jgi:hypothetical protein